MKKIVILVLVSLFVLFLVGAGVMVWWGKARGNTVSQSYEDLEYVVGIKKLSTENKLLASSFTSDFSIELANEKALTKFLTKTNLFGDVSFPINDGSSVKIKGLVVWLVEEDALTAFRQHNVTVLTSQVNGAFFQRVEVALAGSKDEYYLVIAFLPNKQAIEIGGATSFDVSRELNSSLIRLLAEFSGQNAKDSDADVKNMLSISSIDQLPFVVKIQ